MHPIMSGATSVTCTLVVAIGLLMAAPVATAGLLPPVDPLCSCNDHSNQDHSHHDHAGDNIPSINIIGACFLYTDFRDANLFRAFANGASFRGALLSDAGMANAHLDDADLRDAIAISVNLTSASLTNADASGIDLSFATLAFADLRGAIFIDADISDSNFIGANVIGADFSGADLTNAKFLETTISDATTLYDGDTIFPLSFDPVLAGWTLSQAACCVAGNCAVTDQATCLALGGVYFGADVGCATIPCVGPAMGACCIDGTMVTMSEADCALVSGTFLGEGGSEGECPVPCESDIDGDGVIGFEDLLKILADWGPCP